MATKPFIKVRKGYFDCEEGEMVLGRGKNSTRCSNFITADWKEHPSDLMAQLNAFFKDNHIHYELIQVDEGSDADVFVLKDTRTITYTT